jgi:hypothetical protein
MKIEGTRHLGAEPYSFPERGTLRASLETTNREFHRLLDSVSDDRWLKKSPTGAWTVREVFVHLTWSLEYLPREVSMARQGKGMFNMPGWLADPLSYWLIRWLARDSSRESVRKRYDAAMAAALDALDAVPDSDWQVGAPFYGHGFHTVADLFRIPAQHLVEHTVGI